MAIQESLRRLIAECEQSRGKSPRGFVLPAPCADELIAVVALTEPNVEKLTAFGRALFNPTPHNHVTFYGVPVRAESRERILVRL